jgi:hypothetical protein
MKHALRSVAVGCTAVALVMGASTGAANANYLGYGNGDPGNWDFWTEQNGGPVQKTKAQGHVHHAAVHHHDATKKQKQS